MELSFVLIKPDLVSANRVEEIMSYLRKYGFEVLERKRQVLTRDDVLFLYPMHIGKDFFDGLVNFMTSGPAELCIVRRDDATEILDRLVGNQYSSEGEPTLRNLFGINPQRNAIHSPDNRAKAFREISHFFPGLQM